MRDHINSRWILPGGAGDSLVIARLTQMSPLERQGAIPPVAALWRFEEWLFLEDDSSRARAMLGEMYRELLVCSRDPWRLPSESLAREIGRALETGRLAMLLERGPGPVRLPAREKPTGRERPVAREQPASESPGPVAGPSTSEAPQTFVEILLEDEAGMPVEGQRYRLVDAAGGVHEGRLGSGGIARIEPLPFGSCQLSFPDLDARDWGPA